MTEKSAAVGTSNGTVPQNKTVAGQSSLSRSISDVVKKYPGVSAGEKHGLKRYYENVEASSTKSGSKYENVAQGNPAVDKRLRMIRSDTAIGIGGNRENHYEDALISGKSGAEMSLAAMKAQLLIPETSSSCHRCNELEQIVSLWELGVSGLARNYSRILAQLNKARDASVCLESRMKQKAGIEGTLRQGVGSGSPSITRPGKRYSFALESSVPDPEANIVNQMYPEDGPNLPSEYTKHLNDLHSYLGKAIDLCQQLAAACFKNQQSPDYALLSLMNKRVSVKRSANASPPDPRSRPTLSSISEGSPSITLRRKYGEQGRSFSPMVANGLGMGSTGEDSTSESEEEEEEVQSDQFRRKQLSPVRESSSPVSDSSSSPSPSPPDLDSSPKKVSSQMSSRSHKLSSIHSQADKEKQQSSSFVHADKEGSEKDLRAEKSPSRKRELHHSSSSTFSDDDVKQVMSKIASLEEERMKLLETIDELQHSNQTVRTRHY